VGEQLRLELVDLGRRASVADHVACLEAHSNPVRELNVVCCAFFNLRRPNHKAPENSTSASLLMVYGCAVSLRVVLPGKARMLFLILGRSNEMEIKQCALLKRSFFNLREICHVIVLASFYWYSGSTFA